MSKLILPVQQNLLIKYLEEDSDGAIYLVGTIIQKVLGCNMDDEGSSYFKYRFNDFATSDDSFMFRRSRVQFADGKPIPVSTFSVRIPLMIDSEFVKFPYILKSAKCTIEMSTFEHNNVEIRPCMFFPRDVLEKPGAVYGRDFLSVKNVTPRSVDRMKTYDFVTPNPSIRMEYENKGGGYCPKIVLQFWLYEPLSKRMLNLMAPFIIIIVLGVLNIFALQDLSALIGNTSSIALTLVFLIPSLSADSNTPMPISLNDMLMVSVFIGLFISCIKGFFFDYFMMEAATLENTTDYFATALDSQGVSNFRDVCIPFISLMFFLTAFIIPFISGWQFKCLLNDIRRQNYHKGNESKKKNETSRVPDTYVRYISQKQKKKIDATKGIKLTGLVTPRATFHFGFISSFDKEWN